MGEDPSRIDRQITANREHIAATLDAIGYQINIPARLSERSDAIISDAVGIVDTVATSLTDASRATTRVVPRALWARGTSVLPLVLAYLVGMLVGLTWPKPARGFRG